MHLVRIRIYKSTRSPRRGCGNWCGGGNRYRYLGYTGCMERVCFRDRVEHIILYKLRAYNIYYIMENPICSRAKLSFSNITPRQRISLSYIIYIFMLVCVCDTLGGVYCVYMYYIYTRRACYKWTLPCRLSGFRWKFGHLCTSSALVEHPLSRDYFVTPTLDINNIYT